MTMMAHQNGTEAEDDLLSKLDIETEVERIDAKAIAILNRSEVEAQLDAAHKYPRSITKVMREALALATITREVAESCIYSLPRGGKMITGPSVRLAEIMASAFGNLHYGARVVDIEEKEVVSQGVAWDLEKNVRVTMEARRRITNKQGKRYDDDMITVTGNAACAIAKRNAIFNVVPRAYVDVVYAQARKVAVGDAKTLDARRASVLAGFAKLGVSQAQVLAKVEKDGVVDIGLDDLEVLIGIGTAIKEGSMSIDAAFPVAPPAPAAPSEDGKRIKLGGRKAQAQAAPAAQAETQPSPATPAHDEDGVVSDSPDDGP